MYIGIDGGQTKTIAAIMNSDGKVLSERRGTAMPQNGELTDEWLEQMKELLEQLCCDVDSSLDEIHYICGGLCGIDTKQQAVDKQEQIALKLNVSREKITLVNDAITALWGATENSNAIILQHGTAFTSAIRDEQHGSLVFDSTDIGRIYDIREELLVAVARMIDGRRKTTPLKDALLHRIGVTDESEFGVVVDYELIPRRELMSTVSFIFNMWEQGDTAAEEIVNCAAEEYALMCKVMLNRMSTDSVTIVFGGGVLDRAPDSFLDLCEKYMKLFSVMSRIERPVKTPVVGAGLYAIQIARGELGVGW